MNAGLAVLFLLGVWAVILAGCWWALRAAWRAIRGGRR